MNDFISQLPPSFLILSCALPVLLLISLVGFMVTRNRDDQALDDKEPALAMATGSGGSKPPSDKKTSTSRQEDSPRVQTFESNPPDDDDPLDPLDELFRARSEASQEQPVDDDADELSNLMATMTEEEPLHTVTDDVLTVQLHTGDTAPAKEMLSILRDERDGRLMVQVDENAYRTLADSPKARKQFKRIMKELSQVILKPDTPPESTSTPAPSGKPEPKATSETPASAPPAPDVPAKPDDEKLSAEAARLIGEAEDIPGMLPDYTIDDSEAAYEKGRFGRVTVKKPQDEVPELNIAEAINEYLQYRLTQTGKFSDRSIAIRPAISGGVRIFVDTNSYDFVDEIEDDAVRQFVRATVDEWQERH
jgi:hypothetical protein